MIFHFFHLICCYSASSRFASFIIALYTITGHHSNPSSLYFTLSLLHEKRNVNQIPIDFLLFVVSLIFTLTIRDTNQIPTDLLIAFTYFISLFSKEFNQGTSYFTSFISFNLDQDTCHTLISFLAIVLFL